MAESKRLFSKSLTPSLKTAFELSNMGISAAPPYDETAGLITCDVCERLITFVFFRSVKTHRDLCHCCRTALITKSGPPTLTGQAGLKHSFTDEAIYYMGLAPRPPAMSNGEVVVTDVDEVAGRTTTRLNHRVVVQGDTPRRPPVAGQRGGRKTKAAAVPPTSPTPAPAAKRSVGKKPGFVSKRESQKQCDEFVSLLLNADIDSKPQATPNGTCPATPKLLPKASPKKADPAAGARKAPKKAASRSSSSSSSSSSSASSSSSGEDDEPAPTARRRKALAAAKGKKASPPPKAKAAKKAPAQPAKTKKDAPQQRRGAGGRRAAAEGRSADREVDEDVLVLVSQRQGTGGEPTQATQASSPLPATETKEKAPANGRGKQKGPKATPAVADAPPAVAAPLPAAAATPATPAAAAASSVADSDEKAQMLAQMAAMQAKIAAFEAKEQQLLQQQQASPPASKADEDATKQSFKRLRTEGARCGPLRLTEADVLQSPVRAFFAQLRFRFTKHVDAHIDVRPPQDLAVQFQKEAPVTVAEGCCCPVGNAFVGLSRCKTIVAARVVPTLDSEGVWLSILREDDYSGFLECWQAGRNAQGLLEAPVFRHAASVGTVGAIRSIDWVPLPLHGADDMYLGVCSFLRESMVVTVSIPRLLGFAEQTYAVELAGATSFGAARTDRFNQPAADLKWFTTGLAVDETFLVVIFKCTGVVIYTPGPLSKKLTLTVRIAIPAPMEGVPRPLWPAYVTAPPCVMFRESTGAVSLVIARGSALETRAGPDFQAYTFKSSTMPEASVASALCPTQQGGGALVAAYTHDCSLRLRRLAKGNEETITSLAVPIIHAHETADGSGLAVTTAAGQVVVVRQKHHNVELSSSLMLSRLAATTVAPATNALPRAKLLLSQDFDATLRHSDAAAAAAAQQQQDATSAVASSPRGAPAMPLGSAGCRVAHAPMGSVGANSNFALAYFPDGAWVVFPLLF